MMERFLLALSWVNLVVLIVVLAYNVVGLWVPGH
jgi:hypothetical protein